MCSTLECVDDLGVAVIRLRSVEGRRVGGVQRNVWQILIEIELLATLLGSASDRKSSTSSSGVSSKAEICSCRRTCSTGR
jgi:hypothetical protein